MSAPSITATVEPSKNGIARFLKCAPQIAGSNETGHINLHLSIRNTGTTSVHLNKIEIWVPGSSTLEKSFTIDITLGPNGTAHWTQPDDYVVSIPSNPSLVLRFCADGFTEPAVVTKTFAPHASPTPDGSYRFWGEVRDLRPGEFWQAHGTSHGQTNYAQLFGYDVGVAVRSGSSFSKLLPGTDGTKNEHYRIWGKPIYAIAAGTVTDFRHDFPTNQIPGQVDPEIEKFWKPTNQGGQGKDGNGNFFTITTGDETVLYAHMITGSLNPSLLWKGAPVQKGAFLGLAGNSGASSEPHLHIHANASNGTPSWVNAPRPMPFRNAWALAWSSVDDDASHDPWVKLDGRGIPTASCAVWPSDIPVVDLTSTTVRHFAITEQGQIWIVKMDSRIRTTSTRLHAHGIFFDVDPRGLAKEVVARGQKPYVIGMDDKIWEGLPDRWATLPGSPSCRRVAIDMASGNVWVVALDGRIYFFNPTSRQWVEHPGGGRARDICAHLGTPYVIGLDDRIWKSAGSSGWTPLPGQGKGKRIAVDSDAGTLWIIDMNGGIRKHAGSGTWHEHPGGGRAKEIAIFGGTPYVIGLDDGIWKSVGQFGWQNLNLVEPK